MKKFFKSTAFKILLAIALVLLAAIAAAASAADGTTPVSKVTSFVEGLVVSCRQARRL